MATLVVDSLARAARQCSVPAPSSWVSDTTQSVEELRDFLRETVDDILDRADLPSPFTASTTLACDCSDSYDLPATFRRLIRGDRAVFDPDFAGRRCRALPDEGDWQRLTELDPAGTWRWFRPQGYEGAWSLQVLPALETVET